MRFKMQKVFELRNADQLSIFNIYTNHVHVIYHNCVFLLHVLFNAFKQYE